MASFTKPANPTPDTSAPMVIASAADFDEQAHDIAASTPAPPPRRAVAIASYSTAPTPLPRLAPNPAEPVVVAAIEPVAAAGDAALRTMLQAPALAYRRGRGILDSRDPFSVTLPLGHELWAEADAVLVVGTRPLTPLTAWGVDNDLQIVRVDADRDEPARLHKPKAALIGDAAPILRQLIDAAREI